jgi:hypothetical protein
MFYRSLFTNAFTACALFSGEIALADSFNISNDDSSAYSLINSLGEPAKCRQCHFRYLQQRYLEL